MTKNKWLPPVQKGPTVMAPNPKATVTDYDEGKDQLSSFEEQALVIDPTLLVGPLFDNTKSRAKALKDQLGDINTRLQTTLTSFDTVANPYEQNDDMMVDLEKFVANMESGQIKATLKHFINNYRDMRTHTATSSKEREDILYQLSDWFTMDHMDDLDGPVSKETNQEAMKERTDAKVNFEKFKRLKTQIETATSKGLNVDHLMEEKKRLEAQVMGGFKLLKQGTPAKEKKPSSSENKATWRHAADEVVGMLRRVRGENTSEMDELKLKVEVLVMDLQEQSNVVENLKKEVWEKKCMMEKFADDNTDLTDDVAKLKHKIQHLEVDLENAKKLLHKQIDLKSIELPKKEEDGSGKEVTISLSYIMQQLGEVTDANNLKRLTSDPVVLRKHIRENRATIEAFSKELMKLRSKVGNLENACMRKDAILLDLETVNNQLRERMMLGVSSPSDESLHRPSTLSVAGSRAMLSSRTCNCKCHMASSTLIMSPSRDSRSSDEELKKLYKKLDKYRRALSDAEVKLSQAFKQMAEMRRRSMAVALPGADMERVESESSEDEEKYSKSKDGKVKKKISKEAAAKRAKKNVRRKSIKPKAKKDKPFAPMSEPEIEIPELEEPPLEELEDERENTLWKVGDIQGRLNMLTTAVNAFVGDIAKMFEKEEQSKKPATQQFQFGQSYEEKASKNAANQRASEAKQRKDQVMFIGQQVVANIREAYELLSSSLNLGHDDYETIYRAFKKHQQIRAIHHAAMLGRLPEPTNVGRMGSHENAIDYYHRSYRGGGGGGKTRRGARGQSWDAKDRPASETSSKDSLQSSTGILMENGPANSMKRSKSDLQLHNDGTRLMSSGLRTGERNTVFIMGSQEAHTEGVGANKEEVMLPTATVPKKGLIKLTSLDEEHADPKMFSGKKQEAKSRRKWEQKANVLIKRKDIRDQMQEGMRVLEEEEQRKNKAEEEANIEDYTLGDLQTALDLSKDDSKNQDKGQSRQQKAPKLPQVIESIKQQTFQLPVLAKKK